MDVNPSVAEVQEAHEPAALPTLSLNVLQMVQAAQTIHGLKHSDYLRYRQYCTRRLRRLYKGLKFLHGRGRYQKKKLEPATIKDVRHLHIPLVCAERAWAYSMELKNQIEQNLEPRKRQHLIRRLSKVMIPIGGEWQVQEEEAEAVGSSSEARPPAGGVGGPSSSECCPQPPPAPATLRQ